jgi:hypothetical protein
MDLSSPRLKKILIFAAIFTVVVFIAIKIWRRSYYSYPNTSEDAQVSITGMTSGTPTGSTTVTAAGHNFKPGDIVLMKNLPAAMSFSGTTVPMPTVSGTSGTPVIVSTVGSGFFTFVGTFTGAFSTSGSPTAEAIGFGKMTDLKAALGTCQDTYASAIINAGSDQAAVTTAGTNRITCIATAVAPYTRGHCQWLPQANGDPIPVPGAADVAAKAAYDAYQQDIKTIQLAYVQASNRAAAGTFTGLTSSTTNAQELSTTIVSAARAADITGATQKYLATVCPGFYQPGDPAGPDPSSGYKAWTATTGTTAPAAGVTQKQFYASSTTGITDVAILTWAQYASIVTFTAGQGLTGGLAYLMSQVTANGTTYSNKSAYGKAGSENWRLAYANGPGTFPAPSFAES